MLEKKACIPSILRQHVEGIAFLWFQRRHLFFDPAISSAHLARQDLRINAHLLACLASGEETLFEAEKRFEDFQGAGEIFAWLTPALLAGDSRIEAILNRVEETDPGEWHGASGAVAWVGIDALKPFVRNWTQSSNLFQKYLALESFSHFRISPRNHFGYFLSDPSPLIRARAIKLVGELGATDRLSDAMAALGQAEHEDLQYRAAVSTLLLGDMEHALPVLRAIAEDSRSGHCDEALELIVLADRTHDSRKWLGQLIRDTDRRNAAIAVSGALADASVLDWLLSKSAEPDYAAAVTEALRSALPFDLDDTAVLESDPEAMGPSFAGREDGPWAVAARVRDALATFPQDAEPFFNLPTLRRQALSKAINHPGSILQNWRTPRMIAAWT